MKTKHISEKDLASRWNISFRTIQRWRLDGGSLPHFKAGKSVRYPMSAIEAFEENNIASPTSIFGNGGKNGRAR